MGKRFFLSAIKTNNVSLSSSVLTEKKINGYSEVLSLLTMN